MSQKRENPQEGLLISPIQNGTEIDHITAGEALNVLRILGITGTTTEAISVATNVESGHMERKDIVKIANRELRKHEVNRLRLSLPMRPSILSGITRSSRRRVSRSRPC